MVFTTLARLMPRWNAHSATSGVRINRGPDKWWRVQQALRFAWRFRGRARNCFSISIRRVNRALRYATIGRKLKKTEMRQLWNDRITAAAAEHGLTLPQLLEGLAQSSVQLDRKVLSEMAIYEPRTFQSLCEIAKTKVHQIGLASVDTPRPEGVITRGML